MRWFEWFISMLLSFFFLSTYSPPLSHVVQSRLEVMETCRWTVRTERLCAWLLLHALQEGTWVQDNHGKVVHIMSPLCCCQVEMERLRREEEAAAAAREKEQLGQRVRGLEQELAEKQDEVQAVQVRGWLGDSRRWGRDHTANGSISDILTFNRFRQEGVRPKSKLHRSVFLSDIYNL